jgi:glutaconate CoA-transferase subunit B
MPKASSFAEREFQVCIAARLVEDGKAYWVAGGGGPMYSVLLAKRLYTPDVVYVAEDGVVGAEPILPFDPVMTLAAARPSYRALMWTNMNAIGDQSAVGYLDYGVLNALQIDPYGNINSTWLGAYPSEGRRVNGPGGADTIAAVCRRLVLMTDHQRRKFAPKVDFISSPGYLDGTPGARRRAGLAADAGPYAVVTNWAVFDFEPASHHLRLRAIAPFVTLDQVLAEMGFKPRLPESLDAIEVLDPPTEEELHIFRTEMDAQGQFTDAAPRWVTREKDRWVMVEKEGRSGGTPAFI